MEQIDHQREMYPFCCPLAPGRFGAIIQTRKQNARDDASIRAAASAVALFAYATGVFEARGRGSVPYSEPFALTPRAARFACRHRRGYSNLQGVFYRKALASDSQVGCFAQRTRKQV